MNCFPRNHMTLQQYGLWSHVRELQSSLAKKHPNQKFIYFDGDTIASSFKDTGRHSIYRACNVLLEGGWFQLVEPQQRGSRGIYKPRKIVALTHKEWSEWVLKHSETMAETIADQSHLCNWLKSHPVSPVQLTSLTCATDQSHRRDKEANKELKPIKDRTTNPAPEKMTELESENSPSRHSTGANAQTNVAGGQPNKKNETKISPQPAQQGISREERDEYLRQVMMGASKNQSKAQPTSPRLAGDRAM